METAVEADLQEHEMAQEASTASSNDEDDDFFSGMDILTAKRAKLSDANFERLMFMKGNQHHVAGMQAEQAASGRNIVTTST